MRTTKLGSLGVRGIQRGTSIALGVSFMAIGFVLGIHLVLGLVWVL